MLVQGRGQDSKWRGVDPVVPYTDAQQIASIQGFFGLDNSKLRLEDHLITRSQADVDKPKRLYYISSGGHKLSFDLLYIRLPHPEFRRILEGMFD